MRGSIRRNESRPSLIQNVNFERLLMSLILWDLFQRLLRDIFFYNIGDFRFWVVIISKMEEKCIKYVSYQKNFFCELKKGLLVRLRVRGTIPLFRITLFFLFLVLVSHLECAILCGRTIFSQTITAE